MTTETTTRTCQVCARQIKAANGLIAHHGYKRPYEGWQTASCEGARYAPYEVSCERLIEVTAWVENFIARQQEALADFLETPPQTITVTEHTSSWDRTGTQATYQKPETMSQYRSYMPQTYEYEYSNKKYGYEQTIKMASADLVTMRRRIQAWKAPVTA